MSKPDNTTAPAGKGFLAERFDYFKENPIGALKVWEHFTGASKEQVAAAKDAQDSVRGLKDYFKHDPDATKDFDNALEAMDPKVFLSKNKDKFKLVEGLEAAKLNMMILLVKDDIMAAKLEADKTSKTLENKDELEKAQKSAEKDAQDLCKNYSDIVNKTPVDQSAIDLAKKNPKSAIVVKAETSLNTMIAAVDTHLKAMGPKFDTKDPNHKPVSRVKMGGMAALVGGGAILLVIAVSLMIASKAVSAKSLADMLQTVVSKATLGNVTPSVNACNAFGKFVASNAGLAVGAAGALVSVAGMAEGMFQTKAAGLEYAGHKNKEFQELGKIVGIKKLEKAVEAAPGKP